MLYLFAQFLGWEALSLSGSNMLPRTGLTGKAPLSPAPQSQLCFLNPQTWPVPLVIRLSSIYLGTAART